MAGTSHHILAESDGGSIELDESLWSSLHDGHDIDPHKTALIATQQPSGHLRCLVDSSSSTTEPGKHLTWTYANLLTGAQRIASFLSSQHIEAGCIIVSLLPTCAEWALLTWTAAFKGCTLASLDHRVLEPGREDQLSYFLTSLKPDVVVVMDGSAVEAVQSTGKQVGWVVQAGIVLKQDGKLSAQWTALETIAGLHDKRNKNLAIDANCLATPSSLDSITSIFFTSGTSTNTPKGCPRTVRTWLNIIANGNRWSIDRSGVAVVQSPNFLPICSNICYPYWSRGATVIISGHGFDAERTLSAIEMYKGTMLCCVPTHLHAFKNTQSYKSARVSSVRDTILTGDVITTEMINSAQELFPQSRQFSSWGMTEGCAVGWTKGIPNPLPVYQGVVSSGTALPGSKIRIMDVESGQVVPRGFPGELHASGDGMIHGYHDCMSPHLFYEDEGFKWIKTGDMAVMDIQGNVFIIGRIKDIIKKSGLPISAAALESCLGAQCNVEAYLVGVPDRVMGERALAIVRELPSGLNDTALNEAIIRSFGSEYAISGVMTLGSLGMDKWPETASGKISKHLLKKAVLQKLEEM